MEVKGKLHDELNKLLAKDIKTVFLTDSDIRHIKKKHGHNEEPRGKRIWVWTPAFQSIVWGFSKLQFSAWHLLQTATTNKVITVWAEIPAGSLLAWKNNGHDH